jgi:hypothetical protein
MQMSQQEPPRTTINDMPVEILLEIGKNLRSRKDYRNLCYIKSFQRVARELLYDCCGVNCDVVALMMTVLRFPELGALIRKLTLSASSYRNFREPTPEEIELIKKYVHGLGLGLSELQRWIRICDECLNDGHNGYCVKRGIIFALLLLNTPNVTSFYICCPLYWRPFVHRISPDFPWQVVTQHYWAVAFPPHGHCLTRPPPVFQNLKSISIRAKSIDVPQLAPLFKLKSLRELDVWGATDRHASVS